MTDSSKINNIKRRIIEGDSHALDTLYRSYFGKLKFYGTHFTSTLRPYNIDDIIQELFIWIAKNHKKLAKIDNLEVYLFSALKKNIYHEISRNNARERKHKTYLKVVERGNTTSEQSPENKYIDLESEQHTKNWIYSELSKLPNAQREVLYLKYYVNLRYKEIAKIMNLSEQIVRNYAYRGLQKIRSRVDIKAIEK